MLARIAFFLYFCSRKQEKENKMKVIKTISDFRYLLMGAACGTCEVAPAMHRGWRPCHLTDSFLTAGSTTHRVCCLFSFRENKSLNVQTI